MIRKSEDLPEKMTSAFPLDQGKYRYVDKPGHPRINFLLIWGFFLPFCQGKYWGDVGPV
jgi:hypothetical protein